MTQGKVVTHRVVRMQPLQAVSNVERHLPTRVAHIGQTDIRRDARDVRVQRNDELAGFNARPHAAIDAVLWPHHPSQIEVQALACAALRWTREEKPNAIAPLQLAAWIELFMAESKQDSAEIVEGVLHFGFVRRQRRSERAFKRTVVFQSTPDDPKQHTEIPARVESMIKAAQPAEIGRRIEGGDAACGLRSQISENVL